MLASVPAKFESKWGKGLWDRIQALIRTIVERGGYVKDLHGAKNMYYQVNATYYSALGESDARLLLAEMLGEFGIQLLG